MRPLRCLIAALLLTPLVSAGGVAQDQARLRLYVFDAGTLESDPAR